jgi:peptidoglycan hydrolase CwlO-like protein
MLDKAGDGLVKAGKAVVDVVKDRNFQIGVLTGLPATISAVFLIRKYQKQAEEKEELYKKALAKHNAVIKELDAKAEMDKERQDRLLAYDSRLKKEMSGLQSEIQELKNQIAELEKKKADDE